MANQPRDDQSAVQILLQKYADVQMDRSSILEQSVADTAFLVCESRARSIDISQDSYARDWISENRRKLVSDFWEEFSREVYPHDDLEVSIRNRFWLEQLQKFVDKNDNPIFINIGAGLTSYPFLLSKSVPTMEFDRPAVAAYKNARIQQLVKRDILPRREVLCCPINLDSNEDLRQLKAILCQRCATSTSFVLCEGLTYYLEKSTIDTLVDTINCCQRKGSTLGIDFWNPGVATSPVFLRMKTFFSNHMGLDGGEYTFIDREWIENIKGYKTRELTTVAEQETRFKGTKHLQDPTNVLLESYAVLKKG